MELSYEEMITLQSATVRKGDQPPVPLLPALSMTPGCPVDAAIRITTIGERLEENMRRFFGQRDVILQNHGVMLNAKEGRLEDDPEGHPAEGIEGSAEERIALADGEISKLLAVKISGIPPIKGSMLATATGAAAQLLVESGALRLLAPLIKDNLDDK